jgi:hypothetical protein
MALGRGVSTWVVRRLPKPAVVDAENVRERRVEAVGAEEGIFSKGGGGGQWNWREGQLD